MNSGGDSATINVICDRDGVVTFQAVTRTASDDWSSGDSIAPHVGKPLIKTYWFDHLDCDHRELLQVLKKAGAGTADRVRVWVRVDEHQLIRAELTATPLTDESGQTRSVLVRTEASANARRRRDPGEPETKRLSTPAGPDLLELRLSVPILRVTLDSGTILGVNGASCDLLQRPREAIVGVVLSEFLAEEHRRAIVEILGAVASERESTCAIEISLLDPEGQTRRVHFSLTRDPTASEPAALLVMRDLTSELMTHDLAKRADQLASVMARNAERLQQLEAFFDRAPIGLALLENGQIVRSNAAFELQRDDHLQHLTSGSPLADSPATNGQLIRFRAGDAPESRLAVIANQRQPESATSRALARAIDNDGRLAVLSVNPNESLRVVGGALARFDPPPASLDALFGDTALADVRSALQVIRARGDVEPLELPLQNDRFARINFSGDRDRNVLLLIEDLTDRKIETDRLLTQIQRQAESLAELGAKAHAIDPAEFSRALALASDRDAQLAGLVAAVNAGTFTWDVNSGQVTADARAIELLGVSSEKLTAPLLLAAATHDERRAFERAFADAASGERRVDLLVHIGPDRRPMRIIGHVLMDEREADPQSLVGLVLDQSDLSTSNARVTELEKQLAIRSAELNAILESSREAIRIVTNGTVRHNAVAAELFSDDINAFLEPTTDVAASSGRLIDSHTVPLVVEGNVLGVVSVSSDQSETAQLRRCEAEVAAIFANTGVPIAVLDENDCFREVNSALCALIGYAPLQLIGNRLADFVHADDQPTLQGEFDAINSRQMQSCTSDLRLLRRDGEENWVHLTVTRPAGNTQSTLLLVQDIHEQRVLRAASDELYQQLEQTRQEHSLQAMTMQDAVIRLSPNGKIVHANSAAIARLSLDHRQTLAHLSFIAPETGKALGDPLPWMRAVSDRANVVELRVKRPDDSSFVGRFTFRADEDGDIAISIADVSRIHELQEELQKAYARIVESHTLLQSRTRHLEGNFVSAVQQLGSSIAYAYGSAKALKNDARIGKPLKELAQRIVDAFRVHRRLVQYYTASAASGRNAMAEELVDVHELAQQAASALGERFNINGRLELALAAQQSRCRLDGAMIRHAFWSIFAHAVSQAGKTTARVASSSLASTRGGGRLRVSIEWPGARDGTAELTLADSLIQSCGGSFQITPGADSMTATLDFDLDGGTAAPDQPASGKRNILLIEDHESTARVLRRQLERLGCVVSHATSVADARTILDDNAEVDLIISDLSLPDEEATRALTELLRKIDKPAIALRSYGGVEAPEDLLAMGFVDHIDKPVDLNALSAAIARFAGERGA